VAAPALMAATLAICPVRADDVRLKDWTEHRRPELIRLFEEYVFGRTMIGRPKEMPWDVVAEDRHAMGGRAITKTIKLYFSARKDGPVLELSLTLPLSNKPVPLFLIAGNARFNPAPVLDRGYGIMACRVDQIQPDDANGYAKSIRAYFAPPGQTEPGELEWGAIGAWAWGMRRAMDYIEGDTDIDAKKVSISGTFRYARVVLWAAAQDPRFAVIFAQEVAGKGILDMVNGKNGYWFDRKLKNYAGDPDKLPIHWPDLVSLQAPRPVYLSAREIAASQDGGRIYELFGKTGVGDLIASHAWDGEFGQSKADWEHYLDFAGRHLGIGKK